MANDSLVKEHPSDGLTDCHQIHLRKGGLGEEAARVDVLLGCELVERSDQLNVPIWLYEESDGWTGECVWWAHWSCLNDAANSAEMVDILIPIPVQSLLCDLDLLRNDFLDDFLNLFYHIFSHLDFPLPQLHHSLDGLNIQ